MRTRLTYLAFAVISAVAFVAAEQGDAARTMMEAARKKEVVDGDLKGAIQQYRTIADTYKTDRAVVADALVRMAECYQKLGDAESQKIYERVVRDFADQTEPVALARARLGAGNANRAGVEHRITLRKVWDGDTSGTISPDGRFLTYVGNFNTALFLRDMTTGADRPLTSEVAGTYASTISRDGTQVAYDWCTRETCEIRVASLQGTGIPTARRVFGNEEVSYVKPMDWSADGKSIAVSIQRKDHTAQIGLLSVSDGALRVLKSVDWRGPQAMRFSPDNRDIAFDLPVNENSEERDVFVLATDGSREVTAVAQPGNDIVMGWTPDGKHLLFASNRSGAMGLWAQPFAERKPQGAPELLKSDLGNVSPLGIARSGALYMGVTASDQDIEVVSVDLTTGKQTAPSVRPIQRFTGSNQQPTWSPDGRSLGYVSVRGDEFIVAIRSMASGEVRELHPQPRLTYFLGLSWAPDGQSFAAFGGDLKGREGVYRIDARNGEVVPIAVPIPQTERLSYEGFFWSPDGTRLYYHSQNGTIRERDLASGRERIIVPGKPSPVGLTAPDGRQGPISLSPDGRWIASYRSDASTKSQTVMLIPVDGGEPRELLRVTQPQRVINSSMPWTPDGRAILLKKGTTGVNPSEMWLVPISGESPLRIDVDARRIAEGAIGMTRLHPDGKQIALVAGRITSELWVLENFLPALSAKK